MADERRAPDRPDAGPDDVARALEAFLLGEEPSLTRVRGRRARRRAARPRRHALAPARLPAPRRRRRRVRRERRGGAAARRPTSSGSDPAAGVAGRARPHLGSQLRPARGVADHPARRAGRRGRRPGPPDWPTSPARRRAARGSRRCRPTSGAATSPAPRSTCSTDASTLTAHRVAAVGLLRRHRRLHHPEPQPRRRRAGAVGRRLRAGHHRARRRPRRPGHQDHRRRGALHGRRPGRRRRRSRSRSAARGERRRTTRSPRCGPASPTAPSYDASATCSARPSTPPPA